MKQKLFASSLFALSIGSSFAQNDPSIDVISFPDGLNVCSGDYANLYIEVTDLDGDAVIIDNIVFPGGFIEVMNGFPPTTVGNTTTFHYYVTISGITPPATGAIENESINVYVSSISGLDPTGTDNSSLAGLVANGPVFAEFSTPSMYVCDNGLPMDISGMVSPAGGIISWGDAWPGGKSNSFAFDPKKAYKYFGDDGFDMYGIEYFVENVNGCIGTAYMDVYFYDSPDITTSTNPSTCGSATGDATATIIGSPPFDVYWSTGWTDVVSSFTQVVDLSSGVYYVNVTDVNGCKAVGKAPVADSDFSVSSIESPSRCAGQPGMIDLSVSSGGTIDDIFWSNGATTEDITAMPGEYSVEIHTTSNCNFFGTYEILDSALKVKLDGIFGNSSCFSTPNGYMDITTSGGGTAYTWDWKLSGSSFAATEDVSNLEGGLYSCTVTDDLGCSLTWNKTLENYNNVFLNVDETTKSTCGNADGSIDISISDAGDTPSIYSWSNGAITEDLTGVPAGTYTLTYADQAGCTSFLTVKIQNERPYQPSICILTVDTSLIYNEVVWEKDLAQDVAGFNIYRETSEYGVFEKVADRPYALESFYQDNAASPVDRSWRYYITSYDDCGSESYGSFIHKTIHVVANTSDGVNYNLSWDEYEGITYTSVDLHRYDPVNGWIVIGDDLPVSTTTFVDAPPVVTGLDYLVTFNLADNCVSGKVQDHNSSRSNKSASAFNGGGSTVQVDDIDLGYISIYPNPVNDQLTLHVDNPDLFQYYEVRDINGQVVYTGTIFVNNSVISVNDLSAGLYVIQLYADNKVITEKFVKN